MKKELKILIVDDHPLIIEAYKNILLSADFENVYKFTIDTADTCDSAIKKINISSENKYYDVLFFDVHLPPSADGKIISGEGLAIYAKKMLPGSKVVILTMFNENHRIHNILNTSDPDGLLIKNDITSKEFVIAFNAILNDPPYYSRTVAKYFRKKETNPEVSLVDDINRKILYHISKGVKTKDLVDHINLSLSGIHKRKLQIKNLFELESATNDEVLVKEARKRGFL